jgi:hypothetical protein
MFKRQEVLLHPKKHFEEKLELFYALSSSATLLDAKELSYLDLIAKDNIMQHPSAWLQERVDNIKTQTRNKKSMWGWKEPNTHIVIDKILEFTPNLKFIYVYRNGLDMAYSSNQNQLMFWGPILFNDYQLQNTPKNSLKYWCKVHTRILTLKKQFPQNIYMLNMDELSQHKEGSLESLLAFLNEDSSVKEKYKYIFKKPSSIDRYKQYSLEKFDENDLELVRYYLDI